jgi:hypothetical protein
MNNIKVKTQKTLSAILGVGLAVVILLQTGNVQSKESALPSISVEEAIILADIEVMLLKEDVNYEEELSFEELESDVKVYNSKNELIAEGNTQDNEELRKLVNNAELLSENLGKKYFRIAE